MSDHQALSIFLDNTSLQGLTFIVDPNTPPRTLIEKLDALHLAEVLILAEEVCVTLYQNSKAREESERLLDRSKVLRNSQGMPLFRHQIMPISQLGTESVGALAALHGRYGNELFDPQTTSFPLIGAGEGLPRTSNDITPRMFKHLVKSRASVHDLQQMSEEFLRKYGADASFAYAVGHHEPSTEFVARCIAENQLPPVEHWYRLQVIFRAEYNERYATSNDLIYAPTVIRQSILERVRMLPLYQIKRLMSRVVAAERHELGLVPPLLESTVRVPFFGVAVFKKHLERGEPMLVRIAELRADPAIRELRALLTEMERCYWSAPDEALARLDRECKRLERAIRARLGLPAVDRHPVTTPSTANLAELLRFLYENRDFLQESIRHYFLKKSPKVIFMSRIAARVAAEADFL
jgi:hypothetical protein